MLFFKFDLQKYQGDTIENIGKSFSFRPRGVFKSIFINFYRIIKSIGSRYVEKRQNSYDGQSKNTVAASPIRTVFG